MRRLAGGRYRMGSDRFYTEEAPVRTVAVEPFWIDETPVTNDAFRRFVAATGYITLAEIAPNPRDYPGLPLDLARPSSLVFEKTDGPVDLAEPAHWWHLRFDANWKQPLGPGGPVAEDDHPVVHVGYADAQAYARWSGKALPTEAEWEFAARGGLDGADYAWGDELAPSGTMLANYWQGLFPFANQLLDGFDRTSPVRRFPENGYGLYDMIGNVWEWTSDWYTMSKHKVGDCCAAAANPRGGRERDSIDRAAPGRPMARKVLKGGSHLCAENYCRRYRPAARHPQPIDTTTGHVGFRCVAREARGANRRPRT